MTSTSLEYRLDSASPEETSYNTTFRMTGFSSALLNPAFYANLSPTKSQHFQSPGQSYDSLFPKSRSAVTSTSTLVNSNRVAPQPPLGGSTPNWSDEDRIWISRVEGWRWQTWGYDSAKKEWRAWLPKKAADKMGKETKAEGRWIRFAAWPEDGDDDPFFTPVVEPKKELSREMTSTTLNGSTRTMSLAMLLSERSRASLRDVR